ncbi:nitroreductase/quinone reductase family protein [Pengzhenrongella sp.]|jgi:deazaflavin-dependent oxidoreductase (nitroreductase family)|uniref:nitroreductase/quinone reductase family protein n=1 Tax=Pengzhenrongella sp. TaxID=2888820 RepID=UPI002F9373DE
MSVFDDVVSKEFRLNNGRVGSAGFGSSLVLIHSTDARTGESRVSPAMSIEDDGGWLVIASAAGAPKNPGWYFNLSQHRRLPIFRFEHREASPAL